VLAIFRVFRKNATQIYGCFAIFKKTSGSFFFRATRHRQKLVDQKDSSVFSVPSVVKPSLRVIRQQYAGPGAARNRRLACANNLKIELQSKQNKISYLFRV